MTPLEKLVSVILTDSVDESKLLRGDHGFPLQYLKGVGPARAKALEEAGIRTAYDLLTTFPRAWEDRHFVSSISQALFGQKAAIHGRLQSVEFSQVRANLGIAKAILKDGSAEI